ncbi:peptidase family C78 domain-containing protein [Neurospora intermedia]|uniref:Peptidase family C78 domain-containing protein n=1 Tax=Neurospora intermedia TaxID=5142 RepID=A0ABR3D3T2_NEUIN
MGAPEENKGGMVCPFCNWESTTTDEYAIMLHLETNHAEGESPFVVADKPAEAEGGRIPEKEEDPHYIECPAKDCGEVLLAADLGYHLELHAAEQGGSAASETETDSPIITPSAPSPSPKAQSPPVRRPTTSTRTPPSHSSSSSPRPSTTSSSSKAHRGETEGHRRGERKDDHHSDRNRDSNKSKSIWRAFFGIHHPRRSSDAASMSPKPPRKRHKEKVSERLAERASGGTAKVMRGTRLGKAQLGKYAHEEQMPDWLVKHMEKGLYVKAEGIIPVLAQLFEQCSSTRLAFLCHPSTNHVSKLKREGGFCGYRNIQMLSSYIIGTKYPGYQHFGGGIPTIFDIQEMIETAWDHGINAQGRVETGGIRGTRKYIGTPEAMAMFRLLQIPFDVQAFKNPEPGHSEKDLLDMVEQYFQTGISVPEDTDLTTQQIKKVWQTDRPPIYFQHAGHSMTIIGLEHDKSGARNLIVFDPMFHDASNITKHVGRDVHVHHHLHPLAANMALNPYRRGSKYLGRFREFEVIRLRPRPEINA